jgi:glucose-6-phosphate 1-dehydrogenase
MSAQIIPVPPFDLVVFGGTGDLSMRKLMPALYHRDRDGQLPGEARILGVSRSALEDDGYRAKVEEALVRYVSKEFHDPAAKKRFLARLAYVQLDITADGGWKRLHELLDKFAGRIRVFYLATAPDLFGQVAGELKQEALITPETRVVLEKPLGKDLASARAINNAVGAVFDERQIFRIDH